MHSFSCTEGSEAGENAAKGVVSYIKQTMCIKA